MNRINILSPLLWATVILLLSACTKESIKTTFANQETKIETYLQNMMKSDTSAYVVSNKGSQRLVVEEGTGEALDGNGTVSFYYAGYVFTGSINNKSLFATNSSAVAQSASWRITDSTAFSIATVNLGETELVEGLRNGLIGVKGGEEAYILFSGEHGFGSKILGTIPANSALAYHIWVESISNE